MLTWIFMIGGVVVWGRGDLRWNVSAWIPFLPWFILSDEAGGRLTFIRKSNVIAWRPMTPEQRTEFVRAAKKVFET